ncbi:E3 Ubiquitin ligase [Ectothiorhodospira magna]|uniref:RING-type E3 ubiquitin transferase n=1 Tax=Ectothiorhodospira magna TaxID=867345 RepID=A0A1H9EY90_9GAMM|nr:GIDE domain-containing protein [Ectothiorhodospira magna]SEQ30173.1 E3 Ubiquitin ligase [Ectothiorhodospira magna]
MALSVQRMDSGEYFFWVAVLVLILVAALWGFLRGAYRKRLIADTPTSRVRSAAQGYVELIGQARLLPGPSITAPLTGTPCAWYDYRVERRDGSGRKQRWSRIEQGRSEDLFLLQDDTGECLIDPEGAQVVCVHRDVWHGHGPRPVQGAGTGGLFSGLGRYRYTERRLHLDEDLYAIGYFRTRQAGEEGGSLNEEVSEILREWKKDPAILARFNIDLQGHIDMAAWERVRQAALQQALMRRAERADGPAVHIMARGPERRRPYILSAISEADLVRRYVWLTRFSALGFLGAAGGLAWLLLQRAAGPW